MAGDSTFAEWLIAKRNKRLWSQRKLARETNGLVSQSEISLIENGQRNPSASMVIALARALGENKREALWRAGLEEWADDDVASDLPPDVEAVARRIGEAPPDQKKWLMRVIAAILDAEGL